MEPTNKPEGGKERRQDTRLCHACGKEGHIKRNCKLSSKTYKAKTGNSDLTRALKDAEDKLAGTEIALKDLREAKEEKIAQDKETERRLLEAEVNAKLVKLDKTFSVSRPMLKGEKQEIIVEDKPSRKNDPRLCTKYLVASMIIIVFIIPIACGYLFPRVSWIEHSTRCVDRIDCYVRTTLHVYSEAEKEARFDACMLKNWHHGKHLENNDPSNTVTGDAGRAYRSIVRTCRSESSDDEVESHLDKVCYEEEYTRCERTVYDSDIDRVRSVLLFIEIVACLNLITWWCYITFYETRVDLGYLTVRKKKVWVRISGINPEKLTTDLRTDEQKRGDLKHHSSLLCDVDLTYGESLKYFKRYNEKIVKHGCFAEIVRRRLALPELDEALSETRMIKSRDVQISYEMFVQLIKHGNMHSTLAPDVVREKLNQHANYICSINIDSYDLKHLVQDTVNIAILWQRHNSERSINKELFYDVQPKQIV